MVSFCLSVYWFPWSPLLSLTLSFVSSFPSFPVLSSLVARGFWSFSVAEFSEPLGREVMFGWGFDVWALREVGCSVKLSPFGVMFGCGDGAIDPLQDPLFRLS